MARDGLRTVRSHPLPTGLALVCALNGLLLWHFHDRYWYPTDDGLYAHVAQRLLDGEVLNRDIQDIHPGYVHVLHAAAFRVFGLDLLSLRYPLMAAAFVQALIVFSLLRGYGLLLAAAGSVAATAVGVVQFISPTSNWYALALAFGLAWWMTRVPVGHPLRWPGAGFLLGCLTMFRHLSGVWAAMAVLVLAMLEHPGERGTGRPVLARILLGIMLSALVGYLALSPETEPGGVLLMACWPAAILAWMLVHVRTSDADVLRSLGRVAIGVAVPVLPMLLYHLAHGSLGFWIRDNVFAAAGETQMAFFGSGWYGLLPLAALHQIVSSADPVRIVNGVYWLAMPLLSLINGWVALKQVRRGDDVPRLALPVMASFYALVSLYLEGPLYLYYSAGLSLVSLLSLAGRAGVPRVPLAAVATSVAVVALGFHAAQTRFRTPVEILEGRRSSNVWSGGDTGLPRATLRIDVRDREVYGSFVALIERETNPGDSILALPNDAELYFLAARTNPSRFYNSALGLRTSTDTDQLLDILTARPPRLVFFRPDDKYNNDGSARVMAFVRSTYTHLTTLDGAEIYRRP